MKRRKRLVSLLMALVLTVGSAILPGTVFAEAAPDAWIVELKTDYVQNPLGTDEPAPTFGWQMQSGERGQGQKAYQVMVASSAENLKSGRYDMWDSGRQEGSESVGIAYEGGPLQPKTRYYWQVRVWDLNGREMLSDEEAYFETGLMDEGFGNAQWIGKGADKTYPVNMDLTGAHWIWSRYGAAADKVPGETMYFRAHFTLDPQKTVKEAFVGYTADDFGDVYLNGELVSRMPQSDPLAEKWRTGAVCCLTDVLQKGENVIAAAITNGTEGYAGFIAKVVVTYTDDTQDVFTTGADWKLTKTPGEGWAQPELDESGWETPDQLVSYGSSPWGSNVNLPKEAPGPIKENSAPMFRREFTPKGEVASARLYATAAGIYEMAINGQKVSGDYFNPGWTDYHKRVLYQAFDVTNLIGEGANAITAILGNGWYCGNIATSGSKLYGSDPALLARLEITYEDGTKESIVTDESWKMALNGPIKENDLLMGETYDATAEIPGWEQPGFADSAYQNAVGQTAEALAIGEIKAQNAPTVQQMQTLSAVAMTEPQPGVYIYDFGQNFAGNVRIEVKGEKGTTLRLRHGEMLNDATGTGDGSDGTLFTANLRTAKATDYYTLKGDPEGETYQPRFTFHGFRYVEITGLPAPLPLDAVTGVVLYSAMEESGSFESSNELVNKLYSNTLWSQRSNFIVIPTDCPQRDERLGWTGDAQVFTRTATYNMQAHDFYSAYLEQVRDYQREDGAYPSNAPHFWDGHGANGWGDAGVIIPWQLYQQYGDEEVIRENYDAMKAWIAYLKANSNGLIRPNADYGDWMSIVGTPSTITNTGYFAYVTRLLARMAEAIGEEEDAAYYNDLFEQIKAAWNQEFVNEDGSMKTDTQTAYVAGLQFDLFPADKREAAAKFLVDNIRRNDYHLTTGFVGVSYLCPVLSDMGYSDVAYRLLEQESYPSWIYPVTQGATTIWEMWNCYSKESGFSSGWGHNVSFNHYSYGAICEWMYRDILGIERDEENPGYRHFVLEPTAGGSISFAKGHYDTPYGTIESRWDLSNEGEFTYEATVPANTSATLYLPVSQGEILEGGLPASEAQGVAYQGTANGKACYELQSGSYRFTLSIDPDASKRYALKIESPQGIAAKAVIDGVEYSLPMDEMVFGGQKEIEIIPEDSRYVFSNLNGDVFSASVPGTLRLDQDMELSAAFAYAPESGEEGPFTLNLSAQEGALLRVNGQEVELPFSGSFQRGEWVTLDLQAPAGKTFAGWDGFPALTGAPAVIQMNSDLTATALFEEVPIGVNLALHKPVKTNNTQEVAGAWSVNNLTDGVTTGTGYTSNKFATPDTSENPPWFEVDLGSDQFIDRVVLYPRSDGESFAADAHYFPRDFTISVKGEGDEDYHVVKSFTGHPDTSQPVTIDFEGVSARYVRVTATLLAEKITPDDAPRYQMVEIEVSCVSKLPPAVEQIEVSAPETRIEVGETLALDALVSPAELQHAALSWMVHDAQDKGFAQPSGKASLQIDGDKAVLTGLSEGVVDVVVRSQDGRGGIGILRVWIGAEEPFEPSIRAVDEKGEPLFVAEVNEWFTVTAVTKDDVSKIVLLNEYGLKLGLSDLTSSDNGDGTRSWQGKLSVGTVGKGRTLSLVQIGKDGAYTPTDASFQIDVTAMKPEIRSVTAPKTAQVNVPFTLTAVTNSETVKLDVYNEYGLKMVVMNPTYQDTEEGRIWTFTLMAGTKGTRSFDIFAKNRFGDVSGPVRTEPVEIRPF